MDPNRAQPGWATVYCGVGSCLLMLLALASGGLQYQTRPDRGIMLHLFGGPFLLVVYLLLKALTVRQWREAGVEYRKVFKFQPHNAILEGHLVKTALASGSACAATLLLFLHGRALGVSGYLFPPCLVVLGLGALFRPTPTSRLPSRVLLVRSVLRMSAAPRVRVRFPDYWIADQLTSLVPVLLTLHYYAFFYFNLVGYGLPPLVAHSSSLHSPFNQALRSFVYCLPFCFRFFQCLRRYQDSKDDSLYLLCAGKYFITFVVVLSKSIFLSYRPSFYSLRNNPFFLLWVALSVASTLFSFGWDVKMDWGLGDLPGSLRKETKYPSHWYRVSVGVNLFLRFTWLVSFVVTETGLLLSGPMDLLAGLMDVLRRSLWNLFRLEYEHLKLFGQHYDVSTSFMDSEA